MTHRKFLLTLVLTCACAGPAFAQTSANYLFAYFKNNGEDGLHLAHSRDGLQWRALNEDKPYLTPRVGSQKLMRDPCILLGPDGVFHLVWTTGWRGQDIGIAHSRDLIHWSEQRAIPVMAHEPTALNCWAPEIVYDEAQQQYLIFWATTIPGRFPATETSGNNGLNHRMYFTATKDFKTYSPAALFYDDGFNVIDATMLRHAGKYALILKDETQNPTPKKHLRVATSERAAGPYGKASAPFTMDWVEGPTALFIKGEWLVYYDMYRDHQYGAVKSRDLQTWAPVTDKLSFPAGMRHGTAFAVTDEVLARLTLTWNQAQQQKPEWFAGAEAARIADNVLLYQQPSGGWPKNTNMAVVLSEQSQAALRQPQPELEATIDNNGTTSQMRYLARVWAATRQERFQASFYRGLDYLLKAQYANGGWPQFYPLKPGYYTHITFNDDAMARVLTLLQAIANKRTEFALVDDARRAKSAEAFAKGIECILQTQVVVDGKKTVWCAQHDETTLQPAAARAYEKISLSGSESVRLVRLLMSLDKPDARVREAITSAVAWLKQAQLSGIKVVNQPNAALPRGFDRVVVPDASAPPLWARFYDIQTTRPIFCGRDGVIKASLAEIEHERRTGYSWYTDAPAKLLKEDWPKWQARWK